MQISIFFQTEGMFLSTAFWRAMVWQKFSWKNKPQNGDSEADNVCINDGWLLRQIALGDGIITVGDSNLHSTHADMQLLKLGSQSTILQRHSSDRYTVQVQCKHPWTHNLIQVKRLEPLSLLSIIRTYIYRDTDNISSLQNPKPFNTIRARTNKFRKSFISYCLDKYT